MQAYLSEIGFLYQTCFWFSSEAETFLKQSKIPMRSDAVAVPVGQLKFVASSDVRRNASSYVTEAQSVTEFPFLYSQLFY